MTFEIPIDAKPIGYKKIVEIFDIPTVPHFCWSYISSKYEKKASHIMDKNLIIYIYPSNLVPPDHIFEHLEFALKNEGLNLYILKKVLQKISSSSITEYIIKNVPKTHPRILWYLYEEFNKIKLPIPNLKKIKNVPLLNPKLYYCGKSTFSVRHRVNNNLLGTLDFAPIVRKTSLLEKYEKLSLKQMIQSLANKYTPFYFARATKYLYTKETISSLTRVDEMPWNIKLAEKIGVSQKTKAAKFINMLDKVDSIGPLSEETLMQLKKEITFLGFSSKYRQSNSYVRQASPPHSLCYIAPKWEDVHDFMQNLINLFEIMKVIKIHPIITTALLSFGFIHIHPFEDGNGRIHRFLIHYALAYLNFIPKGCTLPLSLSIIQNPEACDRVFYTFSKPLLELIKNFTLNAEKMEIFQETTDFYRFIDFTPFAEYLFECIYNTIPFNFKNELMFLLNYDQKLWDIKTTCFIKWY